MRPAPVYFDVRAADGAVASLNAYPRSRINFPASRRNASRLLYRISLQLTPPRYPRTPAHPSPTSRVDRGSRSRSVLHISFVPGCAPGGWARPGFVPPELQGRWPVARKLKLIVKNTAYTPPMAVPADRARENGGCARNIRAANTSDCALLRRP